MVFSVTKFNKELINGFIMRDSEDYLLFKIKGIDDPTIIDIVPLGKVGTFEQYNDLSLDEFNLVNYKERIVTKEISNYEIQDLALVKMKLNDKEEPWLDDTPLILYEDEDFRESLKEILADISSSADDEGFIHEF